MGLSVLDADQPISIRADPGQLEQALMNHVANPRDAMPHGGKLELHHAVLDADYCLRSLEAQPR